MSNKSSLAPRYLKVHAVLAFAFLFTPIVVLVVFSFNKARSSTTWNRLLHALVQQAGSQPRCTAGVPEHDQGRCRRNTGRDDPRNPRRICPHPLQVQRRSGTPR